jgi:hypothetical protein
MSRKVPLMITQREALMALVDIVGDENSIGQQYWVDALNDLLDRLCRSNKISEMVENSLTLRVDKE